jgi:hypothetical protein
LDAKAADHAEEVTKQQAAHEEVLARKQVEHMSALEAAVEARAADAASALEQALQAKAAEHAAATQIRDLEHAEEVARHEAAHDATTNAMEAIEAMHLENVEAKATEHVRAMEVKEQRFEEAMQGRELEHNEHVSMVKAQHDEQVRWEKEAHEDALEQLDARMQQRLADADEMGHSLEVQEAKRDEEVRHMELVHAAALRAKGDEFEEILTVMEKEYMLKQIARDKEHVVVLAGKEAHLNAKEEELHKQRGLMQAEIDSLHGEVDVLVQNWSQDISRLHKEHEGADSEAAAGTPRGPGTTFTAV